MGSFAAVDELRGKVLRDLMAQVRELKRRHLIQRKAGKIDRVVMVTDIIIEHRRHRITLVESNAVARDLEGDRALPSRSPVAHRGSGGTRT